MKTKSTAGKAPSSMGGRSPRCLAVQLSLIVLLGYGSLFASQADTGLSRIRLPDGFSIAIYADNLDGARSLARGENGTIFVGTRSEGKVYALVDVDTDGRADSVFIVVDHGLGMPNGVAFSDGALFIATVSRVFRIDSIEQNLAKTIQPLNLVNHDSFPNVLHHGWKFIRFGPDGKLYVPVGAPCNVCLQDDARFASIMRMNPDGSDLEVFASGVRNSVGFDWHPITKELWFTDNGRDMLGDDSPPDELNHAPNKGMHFGFPFCHGDDIADPTFGLNKNCDEFTPPAIELGPHVAALGMRFYVGDMFPETYHNQVFIAEHGSWNRSVPIGYRITLVTLRGNRAISYETFADGWLQGDQRWGRPVDLLVMPDGSLLVSDDFGGRIYRISFQKQ